MSVADDRVPRVNKVDVMEARQGLQPTGGRHPNGPVTHAPYRREPYVRAQQPQFGTIDAKAAAWTRTQVLLHWIDEDGKAHNEWVLATRVRRILRAESAWQDPYDED
ncbi:hypothetical protein ABIB35_003112 [Arthrobacter sp. UYP6]